MKYLLPILIVSVFLIFAFLGEGDIPEVARIHVIANSDDAEDVAVKMKVKERVADIIGDYTFSSLDEMEKGLNESLDEVLDGVEEVLREENAPYGAVGEVGVRRFEKRTLSASAFPEGDYLALVVTLGKGEGHNWWSVMFPEISIGASLAFGEEGEGGRWMAVGGENALVVRCLIVDIVKKLFG